MVIARLVAFVIPLGLDTFAVAAALGLTGLSPRQRLRVSLVFAAFEGLTPAVGLLIGAVLGRAIGSAADYVAGGLLITYGVYVLVRAQDEGEDEGVGRMATTHGWALILLGLSVSMDELAVGFTLGLSRVPVIPALVLIAAQAFVLSQLGIRLGVRLSARARHGTERTAGVVLGLLGVWIVLDAAFR
ncbi:MAG TPA: manganese efflux pump [Acidimicrobiales bacterium]|nr:manganese efflux pump [Acidimicrobiales bacterium]